MPHYRAYPPLRVMRAYGHDALIFRHMYLSRILNPLSVFQGKGPEDLQHHWRQAAACSQRLTYIKLSAVQNGFVG